MNPRSGQESEVVELALELIGASSVNPPGDERAVASVAAAALLARGLPAPTILARSPERMNLLVTLEFGRGGSHLCLSGHLDTKPVGHAQWSHDPFRGWTADGRLFGLGAVDMKGAVAAYIIAARRLAERPPSRGSLSLLLTADEENGGVYGADYLTSEGLASFDAVVIGEPGGITEDFDFLHVASRGFARFRFDVDGDQGHSSLSDRWPTVNASVEMARLMADFADHFSPVAPEGPQGVVGWRPTVTTGVLVNGGVSYGVVPGRASFDAEVRTVPGMSRQRLIADLEEFLIAEKRLHPSLRASLVRYDPPLDWCDGTVLGADSRLARAARGALSTTFGKAPPDSICPGVTDAAFFHGRAGIPTLPALGPGLLRSAHGADEWVAIDALTTSVDLYELLARAFCEQDRDSETEQ